MWGRRAGGGAGGTLDRQENQMKGTQSQLRTLNQLLGAINSTPRYVCIPIVTKTCSRMFTAALLILAKTRTTQKARYQQKG